MMSHIKVCIATTCHILFGELPMELYALKVKYTLSTMAFPLPSSWLVSQTTSLSQHVADQWANTWHNLTTIWKASWVYLIEKPMQTRHHNSYLMIPRRVFLLKSGTLSISQGWKLDYLQLKDFFKLYECELNLKQSSTPPQCKIIVAYHTSNHILAIEIVNYPYL